MVTIRNDDHDRLEYHVEERLVVVPGSAPDRWVLRALGATIIGILMVAREHIPWLRAAFAPLDAHHEEVITHIAIAFIVSGIVIFGYEWGSEAKKTAALVSRLVNVLDRHVEKVIKASDREAIANAMADLAGKGSQQLAPQFLNFADALGRLQQGDWAAPAYRAFIERYHGELTQKAQTLADMSRKLLSDPQAAGAEFRVPMPNAVDLADVIVASTMDELTRIGGRYSAVSDAATWAQLSRFNKAHAEAIKTVRTRRLFVLGRSSDMTVKPDKITQVIHDHYLAAKASAGRYQVKITTEDEYHRRRVPELSDSMHFGIFAPDVGAAIAFLVMDDKLSNFRLAPAFAEMLEAFDTMWERFDDLTSANGDAILQDYLLAHRVTRMSAKGCYRGLSTISAWASGAFDRFFQSSMETVAAKQITVRRIFVLDQRLAENRSLILDVMRRHARESAMHGGYEWRVVRQDRLPGDLPQPIAIFDGDEASDDPGEVLNEVAISPSPRLDARSQSYRTYSRAFDIFWATLDFEESIRSSFGDDAESVLDLVRAARASVTPEAESP